ncbi:hypothetical protein NE237_010640 [Protea cynaroides]|uniref:Uncharacterized protein n=1 Tax=Protea cynaroides TaxID=273540 RepID=A0A9Q0R1V5_9MAGN|nr:hypothetical protein NE237_010640 [Protea cynaroides]
MSEEQYLSKINKKGSDLVRVPLSPIFRGIRLVCCTPWDSRGCGTTYDAATWNQLNLTEAPLDKSFNFLSLLSISLKSRFELKSTARYLKKTFISVTVMVPLEGISLVSSSL